MFKRKSFNYILLIVLMGISLLIGNVAFDIKDLLYLEPEAINLFFTSRLPRLLSLIATGAGLSISGLVMQKLVQNKFVSPSTTGVTEFGKLGILIGLVFFPTMGTMNKTIFAFIFALLGSFIFVTIVNRLQTKDIIIVPLLGMMLGMIVEAITTFIALKFDLNQTLEAHTTGSFSALIKGRYELLYLMIPAVILAYTFAHRFNIVALGEDTSVSLGVNYQLTLSIGMIIVTVISALVLTTVGSVPFVGLIVPNMISLRYGDNIKDTLPQTALLGMILVLATDIISRVIIFPYEVSLSLTLGIVGCILFITMILRDYKHA